MDEDKLQQDLQNFKYQLQQVESLIASGSNDEDICKLKDDLQQLVQLTEGSLLSLKKSKLLSYVDQAIGNQPDTSSSSNKTKTKNLQQRRHIIEKYTVGAKCKAPYQYSWGGIQYGNAVIVDTDQIDSSDIVKVMFLNPTAHEMRPCPYYLDGQCSFSDLDCKYSHGHSVNISDLKAFEEPNFSIIKERGSCLAKYGDDLWYRATIREILDNGKISVHYDQYSIDSIVNIEDILPTEDTLDSSSSSESEDANTSDSSIEDGVDEMEEVKGIMSLPTNPTENYKIGEWENHTKGVGSKLLAKMGYIPGKGLGKRNEGMLEPVNISVLPKGVSLDTCKELRETDKLRKPFKNKPKRKITESQNQKDSYNSSSKAANSNDSANFDIFDFINDRLSYDKNSAIREHGNNNNIKRSKKAVENQSPKNLNIELVKVQQEIKNLKKILSSQKAALGRHVGKDKRMEDRVNSKLRSTLTSLSHLEEKERTLQYRLKTDSEKKKLTVF